MPEQNQDNNPKTANRKKNRLRLAVIVVVLAAIIGYLLVTYESAENQLAAIDAARAIPDSENAATIYNELLAEDEEIPRWPDFLGEDADWITMRLPWTGTDYPNLAAWIKEHQPTIARLLRACEFEQCRFPIADYANQWMSGPVARLSAIRGWTYLLARAANNDIAENRVNDAIDKYRCVTQLARHLYQQPILIDHLVAIGVEGVALRGMTQFIMQGDPTESRITAMEDFLLPTQDNWSGDSALMLRPNSSSTLSPEIHSSITLPMTHSDYTVRAKIK